MSAPREADTERPIGTIVVRRNGRMATRVVHDPAPESTDENPVPRCGTATSGGRMASPDTGSWRQTDHALFPNSRKCGSCKRAEEGEADE